MHQICHLIICSNDGRVSRRADVNGGDKLTQLRNYCTFDKLVNEVEVRYTPAATAKADLAQVKVDHYNKKVVLKSVPIGGPAAALGVGSGPSPWPVLSINGKPVDYDEKTATLSIPSSRSTASWWNSWYYALVGGDTTDEVVVQYGTPFDMTSAAKNVFTVFRNGDTRGIDGELLDDDDVAAAQAVADEMYGTNYVQVLPPCWPTAASSSAIRKGLALIPTDLLALVASHEGIYKALSIMPWEQIRFVYTHPTVFAHYHRKDHESLTPADKAEVEKKRPQWIKELEMELATLKELLDGKKLKSRSTAHAHTADAEFIGDRLAKMGKPHQAYEEILRRDHR